MQEAFSAGRLDFFGDLQHLRDQKSFVPWLNKHRATEWVVYSKRPFGGPDHVLEYLGRYTHRVAISNQRLVNVSDDHVSFRWKDYRNGNAPHTMKLHPHEFMRRFLMHVLPRRFVRLRYGGFLANCHRREKLNACRKLLLPKTPPAPSQQPCDEKQIDWKERYELLTGRPIDLCPACTQGRMVVVLVLLPDRATSHPRMDSS
jgi:hypothetical protein